MNETFPQFDREQVEAIYELGDTNGDEVLDMGEFIDIMYPTAGEALSKLSKNYKNLIRLIFIFISTVGSGNNPLAEEQCSITKDS